MPDRRRRLLLLITVMVVCKGNAAKLPVSAFCWAD